MTLLPKPDPRGVRRQRRIFFVNGSPGPALDVEL
jgi:hypothetical protein